VLTVVVAARTKYLKDHPGANLEDLVIYTTTQTHSVGSKAALVLGLQLRSIEVRSEDEFSLREDALRNALEEDAKIGRKPFILSESFDDQLGPNQLNFTFLSPQVATIGSTSSGAVDNLADIREVGKSITASSSSSYQLLISPTVQDYPSLWVHVDAAWAGVALSCPEFRSALHLQEINAFVDSICINFHKVS